MYPSDTNDSEWAQIELIIKQYYPPYLDNPESQKRRGRRMQTDMRDIIDAIFYISKTGCQWKFLPADFPPWGTVRHHFDRMKELGVWDKILDGSNRRIREKEGRASAPTLGILDSQSVKTIYGGDQRGYDGNKKIKGRKRNIVTDVLGCLLGVYVSSAQPNDTVLGPALIEKMTAKHPSLECFALDKGYRGTTVSFIEKAGKKHIIPEMAEGKKVSPKRWIVERTFSWFGHHRRLAKDYEVRPDNSETFIKISSIRRAVARLAKV